LFLSLIFAEYPKYVLSLQFFLPCNSFSFFPYENVLHSGIDGAEARNREECENEIPFHLAVADPLVLCMVTSQPSD
jgi:hypothetical protein